MNVHKLTDVVTADDFAKWILAQFNPDLTPKFKPGELAGKTFDEHQNDPEIFVLCDAICEFTGQQRKQIGPVLSYLDAAIRWRSRQSAPSTEGVQLP